MKCKCVLGGSNMIVTIFQHIVSKSTRDLVFCVMSINLHQYQVFHTIYPIHIINNIQVAAAWCRKNCDKDTYLLTACSSLNTKFPVSEDVKCDQLGNTIPTPPPPIPHYNTEHEDDQHSITEKWSGRKVTSPIEEQAQTMTHEQSRKFRAPQAMTIKDTKEFI